MLGVVSVAVEVVMGAERWRFVVGGDGGGLGGKWWAHWEICGGNGIAVGGKGVVGYVE